jgi:hypothetical protein
MNNREAEQPMQLDQFIMETMAVFATDADEILVESARRFRANVGPKEGAFIDAFNAQILALTQNGGPSRTVWGKFDCDLGDLPRRSLRPAFTCGEEHVE